MPQPKQSVSVSESLLLLAAPVHSNVSDNLVMNEKYGSWTEDSTVKNTRKREYHGDINTSKKLES